MVLKRTVRACGALNAVAALFTLLLIRQERWVHTFILDKTMVELTTFCVLVRSLFVLERCSAVFSLVHRRTSFYFLYLLRTRCSRISRSPAERRAWVASRWRYSSLLLSRRLRAVRVPVGRLATLRTGSFLDVIYRTFLPSRAGDALPELARVRGQAGTRRTTVNACASTRLLPARIATRTVSVLWLRAFLQRTVVFCSVTPLQWRALQRFAAALCRQLAGVAANV